ncbi:MAG TPA: MaoC family dehydratase N-terminal domain-containing protein [Candidatus Nanopelagicales bacterium]|nr:MaoC family dehydratase N-terminal domain-containing protein [Candidatus Nanopelagicales bacterium]
MALNLEYAGRSYPPGEAYEIGLEKVREFAAAVGEEHPAHHDPAAAAALGHPGVLAPPTFAFSIAMAAMAPVLADPGLGLDYSRVVHGDQRFRYVRPLRAGDRVRASATLESLRTVAGNDMVTVRCDIADESGAPVVTTWTVLVARGEQP